MVPTSVSGVLALPIQNKWEISDISQDPCETPNSEAIITHSPILENEMMIAKIAMTKKNKPTFALFPAGSVESDMALSVTLKWLFCLR